MCPDKPVICVLCHLRRPGHDSQLRHFLVWKGRDGGTGQRSCQCWNPTGAAAQPLRWAHSRGWAGGSRAAFGITLSPDPFTQQSSTELQSQRGRSSSCAPAQGGSGGCGAAAPPFSAHCTQPLLLSPACATLDHSCAPPAPHHLPLVFFSTIHHFSINAVSPGLAALFVPYKAGVQGKGSPLLGPAPASSPANMSLLALYMTQLSSQCTIHIFFTRMVKNISLVFLMQKTVTSKGEIRKKQANWALN